MDDGVRNFLEEVGEWEGREGAHGLLLDAAAA